MIKNMSIVYEWRVRSPASLIKLVKCFSSLNATSKLFNMYQSFVNGLFWQGFHRTLTKKHSRSAGHYKDDQFHCFLLPR